MKLKLKENKMCMADYISPEIVVAEFNSSLTQASKENFINDYNFGIDLIQVIRRFENTRNIYEVTAMIEAIYGLYGGYDYRRLVISKTARQGMEEK